MLYHWDSVNFALGIQHFDVRLHQPHPPGYLLYVMLGRVMNAVIHDPNASLVWISIIFSGLTAAGLFILGSTMFSRWEGAVAALSLVSSPLFWFHGEVALTYVVEAFFTTILALMSYQLLRGKQKYLYMSALILGIVGGIRQSTLFLILPMWLFCVHRFRLKQVALALFLLVVTIGAWLIPMMTLSGGVDSYLKAAGGTDIVEGSPFLDPQQLVINAVRIGVYVFYGLLLGVFPLAYGALRGLEDIPRIAQDKRAHIIVLWLTPSLLFLCFVHIRQSGHIFVFLPALFLLIGCGLVKMSDTIVKSLCKRSENRRQTEMAVVSLGGRTILVAAALLMFVNAAFFFMVPPYLLGIERTVLHTPSLRTIQFQDQYLSEAVEYIRSNFPPETTVILAGGLDFRHPDYYLPEYTTIHDTNVQLDAIEDGICIVVLFGQVKTSGFEGAKTVSLPSGDPLTYIKTCSQ